jgi:hypothetical protein
MCTNHWIHLTLVLFNPLSDLLAKQENNVRLLQTTLLMHMLLPYIVPPPAVVSGLLLHLQNKSKSNVRLLKLYESGLPG